MPPCRARPPTSSTTCSCCSMPAAWIGMPCAPNWRRAPAADSAFLAAAIARWRCRGTAHAAHQILLEILPQFHVAFGQLVEHGPRGLPDQAAHLLPELLLLFEEHLHGALEVIAH